MLAHGNGLDKLVLASGSTLALAVRLLVAHRRTPTTQRSRLVSEQQPHQAADDGDLPDPAESHGSDLDIRIGNEDQAEQTQDADNAGP